MYRVIKPSGFSANVTIENTDTMSSITIGTLRDSILDILDETKEEYPATSDEWCFEVNKDTATELSKLAMKMKKPIRDQSKKAKDLFAKENHKETAEVDAFDLIFG